LRYWLLTTEYPPFFGGGISTYCKQTATLFSEAGHEVSIFMPHYEASDVLETKEGSIRIIRFNPTISGCSKFLGFEANLSFAFAEIVCRKIESEGPPAVIESQEYNGIAYYLLQKKHLGYPLLKNQKIILTLHAPSFLYFDYNQVPLYKHPNFWTGEMERFCIRATDLCITPSAFLPEAISTRTDLRNVNIKVLPNPFSSEYLKDKVPDFKSGEVVFYGKIIPQKGCIELLHYFKELWEEGKTTRLRMIGGGQHFFHPLHEDLTGYLQRKYKKYLDQGLLVMEGSVSPDKLYDTLHSAHIIVIPSIVDNLPYAVLETMAMGKIVLASVQGGQREIIDDGVNGYLFSHEIKNSFREALDKIMNLTREEILQTGQRAKEKIQDTYSPKLIYKQKLELIEGIQLPERATVFPLIRPPENFKPMKVGSGTGLLSVVIPYYNMGEFLPETINSIRSSGYPQLEIIIVNDGSDDTESLDVLKQYTQDPAIRVIHQKNEGLALARNAGALASNGEFLAFLDPDDTVEPPYYWNAVQLLKEKENISFVGCWAKYFGESSDTWPTFNPEPPYVLLHNCMNTSALVYKRSHFLDAGLNDSSMIYGMEDYDSMLGMLAKGYRGVSFPETWWNYRIRKNSMAQRFTNSSKLYLYKRIAEKHRIFYALYATELFMLLNTNGPSINIDNPTLNTGNYSTFASSRLGQRLIRFVKKNKYMRIAAVSVYKRFSK
jgi:glycosyltransferase involved in cell wall biosynthesis